jgi:hypothetical protein
MRPLRADSIFAQVGKSLATLAIVFVCILRPDEPKLLVEIWQKSPTRGLVF